MLPSRLEAVCLQLKQEQPVSIIAAQVSLEHSDHNIHITASIQVHTSLSKVSNVVAQCIMHNVHHSGRHGPAINRTTQRGTNRMQTCTVHTVQFYAKVNIYPDAPREYNSSTCKQPNASEAPRHAALQLRPPTGMPPADAHVNAGSIIPPPFSPHSITTWCMSPGQL
jgi:hypothetical protein